MHPAAEKPAIQNNFRFFLAKSYHTAGRYIYWLFGGLKFARKRSAGQLCEVASHATPMLRRLKDVDMRLQYGKIINLRLASDRINGVTLLPGETFSFWKAVGRPSRRKGYAEGMVLRGGTVSSGTGGGLCQLTNLIYWMTLHTPLAVTERHRHGYDVFPDADRTQPFGSGASCFYNYMDLTVRNDTPYTFRLEAWVDGEYLRGRWLCSVPADYKYEVYEREHVIRQESWGGYTRHNVIFRKKYDMDGRLADDEYVVENHAVMMYSPLLGKGDG